MDVDPVFESVGTFTTAQFRVWVEEREARGDINDYELLHGRIVMNPPAGLPHGEIEAKLGAALLAFVRTNKLGRVFGPSQGFELPSGDTVSPDASFTSTERWQAAAPKPGPFLRLVPELVAEIFSPATATRDRGEKLAIYEANRVLEYWQVDPPARRVRVLVMRDGRFIEHQLVEGQGSVSSQVLVGLSVALADIFD